MKAGFLRISNVLLVTILLSSQFAYTRGAFRARPRPRPYLDYNNQNWNKNNDYYNKKWGKHTDKNSTYGNEFGNDYFNNNSRIFNYIYRDYFRERWDEDYRKELESLNPYKDRGGKDHYGRNLRDQNLGINFENGILDIRNCDKELAILLIEYSNQGNLIVVTKKMLNDSVIRKALIKSNNHLCVQAEKNEPETLSILQDKASRIPKIIAIIPDGIDGISKSYSMSKKKVMRRSIVKMKSVRQQWNALGNSKVFSRNNGNQSIASDIKAELKKSNPGEMIIVFGHSKNGRLICPDGSSLSIDQVHWLTNHSFGAVLSCETTKYSNARGLLTNRRLHFDETAKAISKINSQFRAKIYAGEQFRNSEYLVSLNKELFRLKRENGQYIKIGVGTVMGGSVLALIIAILDDDEEM